MNDLCSIPNSEVVASPELKPESPTSVAPSWYPTESQGAALHKLHEVADVFSKTGDNRLAGLRPGCRRVLLVGSSGAGKTAVAGQFATECGVPLLCIDGGSWVVTGSLKTSTLRVLRDFIRSCEDSVGIHGEALPGLQGVLYLDELCKLLPDQESLSQSHWSLGVAAETIAVADADTRLLAHDWSPRDVQRLRANFILVAGGAFASAMIQARQSAERGSLGFGATPEKETYSSKIKQFLPEEILSRFSTVITLEAPRSETGASSVGPIIGLRTIKSCGTMIGAMIASSAFARSNRRNTTLTLQKKNPPPVERRQSNRRTSPNRD
jgi:hypothetical protein